MATVDVIDMSTKLPLEMWRNIFEQTHDATGLHSSAQLCKHLQVEAEAVLYKSIALRRFSQVERLKDTLQSSPRRTAAVRTCCITFTPTLWPHSGSEWMPEISHDVAQCLNALLIMLTRLQSLTVQRGPRGYRPGTTDDILRGCPFALSTFTTEFAADDGLLSFFGKQPTIEELNMFPSRIFPPFIMPKKFLPQLKIMRASDHIIRGLQAPHSITHLTMSYEAPDSVDFVVKLLGPQLVSLSLCRCYIWLGNALPFTDSESVDLPCLTHVATRTIAMTVVEITHISAHKPINLEKFYPPRGPVKTWEWSVSSFLRRIQNETDSENQAKYNASVAWFAAKMLKEWPSLEEFVFIRLDYSTSTVYSLDDNDQLIQREGPYAEPFQWRHS